MIYIENIKPIKGRITALEANSIESVEHFKIAEAPKQIH